MKNRVDLILWQIARTTEKTVLFPNMLNLATQRTIGVIWFMHPFLMVVALTLFLISFPKFDWISDGNFSLLLISSAWILLNFIKVYVRMRILLVFDVSSKKLKLNSIPLSNALRCSKIENLAFAMSLLHFILCLYSIKKQLESFCIQILCTVLINNYLYFLFLLITVQMG